MLLLCSPESACDPSFTFIETTWTLSEKLTKFQATTIKIYPGRLEVNIFCCAKFMQVVK